MARLLDDFAGLLLDGRPLLDVRAPVEFRRGAFPGAVNVPLLEDEEREAVGISYQREGPVAAVALGHRLVSGRVRAERLARWAAFARAHPDGALYCFRGGQRSEIVQAWLAAEGIELPRVPGGYKAMRGWLLAATERLSARWPILLLGGRTGVGKTEVLPAAPASIDLEGLANHRGSGFGRRATPQPTPIDFENRLAIEWLRLERSGATSLVLEDESRCVGRCALPLPLWQRFAVAPVVVLEDAFEARVARIRREYVEAAVAEFEAVHPGEGFQRYRAHLLDSLDRIRRRLGGAAHRELRAVLEDALRAQQADGITEPHDRWIAELLRGYYDPMYDHQLAGKAERVVFSGDAAAVRAFLRDWQEARSAG